ncbi:predicted protein [Naegleria gruberi]|uniref:Predicted protein n=1 Tax=Naegleria gruberi TaxID=5762 RepID=D2VYW8_NAEGR|nr:uncharacterized protein NAEGRDRAFT_74271 [Naegleria gruberi]EFC37986.1 predicted protein [Naegleria gruberi]|eukprot:XP_002670730.1 predicted protein [Naegleria gruberi strain NEG-M]
MDSLEFSPFSPSSCLSLGGEVIQTSTTNTATSSNSHDSPSKLSIEEEKEIDVDNSDKGGKHPIACARCRKLHKKCDKKLTGCSKCANAGVDCVYKTPQKRGKGAELYAQNPSKKKKKSSESISLPSTEIQLEKKGVLTGITMTDVYFTFVCGIHPMIEKEKLKYFVNNCLYQFENKSTGEELILEDNIWIKSIGEMKCLYALYLALMSVSSQIVADLETVDKCLRKAEIEVALLSIDYSTEFYWAVACHYINVAYIGDGDQYKSRYYLSKVNFYLENHSENSNPFYRVLYTHSGVISSRFRNETFSLQTLLNGTKNMFEYFTNRKVEDVFLPGTWEYMMNTKISQQNYLLFKQVSDYIFKVIGEHKFQAQRSLTDCHSTEYFKIQRLFTCMLTEGFSFMFMKQIPEISFNVMEEIALKITLMTENEMFPFLVLGTINIVVETTEFHLGICKKIDLGLKPKLGTVRTSPSKSVTFDYFSILEKDLRALKILAARYRRVMKLYPNLISDITELIERNKMKDQVSSTLLSVSEIPPFFAPPQQDEILRKQLEQAFKRPEDVDSYFAEQSLGDWEELFNF